MTQKRMPIALVTGFEPFGGDSVNPSQLVAEALDGRVVAGWRVAGCVLPCVFGESRRALAARLGALSPSLVLCLGLAAGRSGITPERIAINVDDARIPDNKGRQPVDTPVVRGGPAAYWSTLPVKAIVARLASEGIPAAVSQSAGTFVCNHVFYALMHGLRRRPRARGGFIHLPSLAEPGAQAAGALPLGVMVRALEATLDTCARTRRDLRQTGGAVA